MDFLRSVSLLLVYQNYVVNKGVKVGGAFKVTCGILAYSL